MNTKISLYENYSSGLLHVEQLFSNCLTHIKLLFLDQMTPACVFLQKFINTFDLDFLYDTNTTGQQVEVTNISL